MLCWNAYWVGSALSFLDSFSSTKIIWKIWIEVPFGVPCTSRRSVPTLMGKNNHVNSNWKQCIYVPLKILPHLVNFNKIFNLFIDITRTKVDTYLWYRIFSFTRSVMKGPINFPTILNILVILIINYRNPTVQQITKKLKLLSHLLL